MPRIGWAEMTSADINTARSIRGRGRQLSHVEARRDERGNFILAKHYKEDGMKFHRPDEQTFKPGQENEMLSKFEEALNIVRDNDALDG